MVINCIIDGNYVLSRLVFTLHKNNLLYGALYQALENAVSNYRAWYPFSRVYFVSDSREKSWRKKLNTEYKSHRKKDTDIDWKFVYDTYNQFKLDATNVNVFECARVEGDDWISLITSDRNSRGESTFIVTNDHDIKQLIKMDIDSEWINIMSNEMYNKSKVYMPKNYQMFYDKISKKRNDDIFNLNNNSEFLKFYDKLHKKNEVDEVDHVEALMIKIISGDRSDNIPSVWRTTSPTGKTRGIGVKGAKGIYDYYIQEFGEVKLEDPDMVENFADLICEKKKLSKTNIDSISKRIMENFKIMDLDTGNIPPNILTEMKELYG